MPRVRPEASCEHETSTFKFRIHLLNFNTQRRQREVNMRESSRLSVSAAAPPRGADKNRAHRTLLYAVGSTAMRICVLPNGTSMTSMGSPQMPVTVHAGEAGGSAAALDFTPQVETRRPLPVIATGIAVELNGTELRGNMEKTKLLRSPRLRVRDATDRDPPWLRELFKRQ